MTDQASSGTSSAPGGAPAPPISPAPVPAEFDRGSSSSFIRSRVNQMMAQQQPAPSDAPASEAREQQPPQQRQQTPPAPGERTGDYPQEVNDALARDAEAQVRRNTLPKTAAEYQAKLPANFENPAGVNFQFDQNSPELAQAKKIALARGMDQDTFSDMLGVYAATKISEQINTAKAREANAQQLGPAGPQRVDAVGTWLAAKHGDVGRVVASFIKQYPAAPLVQLFESVIKQQSSQGGADFSQSHRVEEEQQGKIPGYDNMSFVERRVHQMAAMLNRPGYRGGGSRRGE